MADTIPTPGDENAADPTGTSAEVGPADVDASAISGVDPSRPAETTPEPEEESDEEWMRRFIEENIHLASPPVVRPPAPPPQPWDGPRSQWKVPDHLSMPHPNGGYMAMALMSRTMDDLDEVTGGKRAATYEEVDKYFGHALIAEGLVPFSYTADEAIRWWKAGGYRVLGGAVADAVLTPRDVSVVPAYGGDMNPAVREGQQPSVPAFSNATFVIDPNGEAPLRPGPAVLFDEKPDAFDRATPLNDDGSGAETGVSGLTGASLPGQRGSAGTTPDKSGRPKKASGKAGARAAAAAAAQARALEKKIELGFKRLTGMASNDPYSPDNLDLGVNEQFAEQIGIAARQSGLSPQTVAAIINAEAAKGRGGTWDPKSKNPDTSARGLTQFLEGTWTGEATIAGTYLNGVARKLGYLDQHGHILPANKKAFLDLRFDPQHSISAAADYAARNIAALGDDKLVLDKSPAALARYAYIAHHEGLDGGRKFLRGDLLVSDKAWNSNVPKKQSKVILAANGGDRNKAYRVYMQGYIDRMIDVRHHMIDPDGVEVPPTATLMGEAKGNEKGKSK